MFLSLLAYLIISAIVLVIWVVSDSDTSIVDVKPSLGRRVLIILLTPSVFLLGLFELVCECLKKQKAWSQFGPEVLSFFSEIKEAWNGR